MCLVNHSTVYCMTLVTGWQALAKAVRRLALLHRPHCSGSAASQPVRPWPRALGPRPPALLLATAAGCREGLRPQPSAPARGTSAQACGQGRGAKMPCVLPNTPTPGRRFSQRCGTHRGCHTDGAGVSLRPYHIIRIGTALVIGRQPSGEQTGSQSTFGGRFAGQSVYSVPALFWGGLSGLGGRTESLHKGHALRQ